MESPKTFREAIQAYRDGFGLVCPRTDGQSSGNGILYTSEYHCLLAARGELKPRDVSAFLGAMSQCEVAFGVYARYPGCADQEGPDDYVGICAGSHALDTPIIPRRILARGIQGAKWGWSNVKWVYNNVDPGKFTFKSWLGRQPQLIAHFYFAAGFMPPLWRRIWWAITVALSGITDRKNHDARILSWLLIHTAYGHSVICDFAAKIWYFRLTKDFPGGISEVFKDYFQNPDHPLVIYSKGLD